MLDPNLSDIDFVNKMAWIWTTLNMRDFWIHSCGPKLVVIDKILWPSNFDGIMYIRGTRCGSVQTKRDTLIWFNPRPTDTVSSYSSLYKVIDSVYIMIISVCIPDKMAYIKRGLSIAEKGLYWNYFCRIRDGVGSVTWIETAGRRSKRWAACEKNAIWKWWTRWTQGFTDKTLNRKASDYN